LGLHVSTNDGSSSGPQNIDPNAYMFNALWDPQSLASQAKSIYLYKNIRSKLLKYCVSIYFNKVGDPTTLLNIYTSGSVL